MNYILKDKRMDDNIIPKSNIRLQKFNKMLKYNVFMIVFLIGNLVIAQDDIAISDPVFGKAEVSAPVSVTLSPGFHAVEGCDFRAYIGPYQGSINTYTSLPEQTVLSTPSSGENYIKIITLREEQDYIPPASYEHMENIQYFDGLGRLIQTINVHESPEGDDIIQPVIYDQFGRESSKYLPYVESGNGQYRSNVPDDVFDYYSSPPPDGRSSDNSPWIQITFDNSPLNRIISEKGPGEKWHLDNKPLNYNYTTNTATVENWSINNDGTFTSDDYSANELYVIETTDEDGNIVREYTDKQGKTVQKESEFGAGLRTLYIYDDLGRLRCVVPPKASDPDQTDLCYYYKYDKEGRMIMKNIPGTEPVYMVYDKRDNIVLTQDGKTRLENSDLWYFTKYDELNRPVMTGHLEVTTGLSHSDIIDDFETYGGILYETYNGTTNCYGYSANSSYPANYDINADDILTVTYYDDYDFVDDVLNSDYECYEYDETYNTIDFIYSESDKTKGLFTGSMTKVLTLPSSGYTPDKNELFTVSYYDDYGNVVRNICDNHQGGKYVVSTNYKPISFEIENTLHLHKDIGDELRIFKEFKYDHTGRLLETTQQINDQGEVVLNAMEYNALGELITKYIHSKDVGATKNFIQKTDYAYNVRGWLKSVNNISTGVDNDVFRMNLDYEILSSEINNLVSQKRYNGNIAGIKWTIKNDITRGYGFEYDELNRLTDAHYGDGPNLDQNEGYYSVFIPTYDDNGNIIVLKRYFNNILVDDLNYNYYDYGYNNQLQSVTDNGIPSDEVDDYPGTSSTYTYDDNGNMIYDGGKDLNIDYNYLNLPKIVDFGGDNKLFYHYDAAGNKLVKYKDVNGGTDEVTHYIGNIVYNGNDISYILTDEGRIVPYETDDGIQWLNEYHIKDHLGNTHVVFSGSNLGGTVDVLQHSNYYPFGLPFDIQDYNTAANGDYTENKYLYNSKELQDDMLASKKLDWYDYGARMYDPQICSFISVDLLAEKYASISPYSYCANNPIIYIDPDGQRIVLAGNSEFQAEVWKYMVSLAMNSETGYEQLKSAIESDKTLVIYAGNDNEVRWGSNGDATSGKEAYSTLTINFEEMAESKDGAPGSIEASLGHELSHFNMELKGGLSEKKDGYLIEGVSPEEIPALEIENSIRKELGIGERKSYSGLDFYGKELGKNEKYSGYYPKKKTGTYAPVKKGVYSKETRTKYLNNVKRYNRKYGKTYYRGGRYIKGPGVNNQRVYE
ncbi:MAG: RHS repeat-associated core domain-containing protein [Bacteroidales bacterium]|nr:MAG: RHS repeat-associated core domain-containing protein [Bacteroidales bacterium]